MGGHTDQWLRMLRISWIQAAFPLCTRVAKLEKEGQAGREQLSVDEE